MTSPSAGRLPAAGRQSPGLESLAAQQKSPTPSRSSGRQSPGRFDMVVKSSEDFESSPTLPAPTSPIGHRASPSPQKAPPCSSCLRQLLAEDSAARHRGHPGASQPSLPSCTRQMRRRTNTVAAPVLTGRQAFDTSQIQKILDQIRRVPVFEHCPPDELIHIVNDAEVRDLPRYTTLIRQGALGVTFYVLVSGELLIWNDGGLSKLVKGCPSCVGEASLLARIPRSANVMVNRDCRVMAWRAEQLIGRRGLSTEEARIAVTTQALRDWLPFFGSMQSEHVRALASISEIVAYPRGVVFPPGQMSDQHFLVLEGMIEVWAGEPPPPFGNGDNARDRLVFKFDGSKQRPWVGEMSLWRYKPDDASVISLSPSKLLVFGAKSFARFLEAMPQLRHKFNALAKTQDQLIQLTNKLFANSGIVPTFLPDEVDSADQQDTRTISTEVLQRWETLVQGLSGLPEQRTFTSNLSVYCADFESSRKERKSRSGDARAAQSTFSHLPQPLRRLPPPPLPAKKESASQPTLPRVSSSSAAALPLRRPSGSPLHAPQMSAKFSSPSFAAPANSGPPSRPPLPQPPSVCSASSPDLAASSPAELTSASAIGHDRAMLLQRADPRQTLLRAQAERQTLFARAPGTGAKHAWTALLLQPSEKKQRPTTVTTLHGEELWRDARSVREAELRPFCHGVRSGWSQPG